MVRRFMIIGISLMGLTLALGSNAWAAGHRGDRGHRTDNGYHHNYKAPSGHYYGWDKGKRSYHRERVQRQREYRHRDHRWRRDRNHYRDRFYRHHLGRFRVGPRIYR
jgi:hypothetical protein